MAGRPRMRERLIVVHYDRYPVIVALWSATPRMLRTLERLGLLACQGWECTTNVRMC